MKRKGMIGMLINVLVILLILVVLALGGGILFTAGERREAKNLPIGVVDFSKLKDGTYTGEYEGGMYKWRANKVQVKVSSGKVAEITQLEDKGANRGNNSKLADDLFDRVIEAQSLQVDTISGATLTSKAYLKSVENALTNAQGK